MLLLSDISVRFDDHVVLDRVHLSLQPGDKAGIIGDNGSGKSTLLKVMAGRLFPGNGTVTVTAPGGTGYLGQVLDLPDSATVGDAIDHCLLDVRELESLVRQAEQDLATESAGSFERYSLAVQRFEARGGYRADAEVEIALHGLGRPGLPRDRRLGTLSGGDRARLALAATLASDPELLLLDEPTNDLDDAALAWLEQRLQDHRGTLVTVTHDRMFLDRLTTTIVEVDGDTHTLHRHGNGYKGYLTAKAAARARHIQQYEHWKADLSRQASLVAANAERLADMPRKGPRGFSGAGAFRARSRSHGAISRIRSAKENLRRLTAEPVTAPPEPLRLNAELTGGWGELSLEGITVRGRLHVAELKLQAGQRLLVTGANGAGKSTLLNVMAGELVPDSGTVSRPDRLGFLRQRDRTGHREWTVLEAFGGTAGELLSLGLFRPEDLNRPVATLSAGQRRRIDLARIVRQPSDLLLLDEPTNHLSPDLVEQLEDGLTGYPGIVVLVSHDRRMLSRWQGMRIHLEQGVVC